MIGWIRQQAQERRQRAEQRRREHAEREAETQAQAARRLRRLSVGLVVLVLLSLGAAGLAWQQWRKAEAAKREAEEARDLAQQAEDAAETAAREAGRQKLKAQEQTRIATARQVAAQALSRYVRLDLALLLSLEADRIANTVEGRGSLLEGLQRNPHLTTFLTGHTSSVSSVAFSPDGKTLASGSGDNTIILWDVSFQSWQARACRIANRNLRRAEWAQYIGDIEPYRATCPELPPDCSP